MANEKVLGYSIEVRGTDDQVKRQEALKKSILETTNSIKSLKEATKDNIDKQKEYAGTLANLEVHLKAETKLYNDLNKEMVNNATAVASAAGSYDALVKENGILLKQLHAMPDAFNPANAAANNLKTQIAQNTQRLKDFDETTNRHFRSVGNYSGGILTATKGLKGFAEIGTVAARMLGIQSEHLEIAIQGAGELVKVSKAIKEITHATTTAKKAETVATEAQIVADEAAAAAKTAALGPWGWALAAATALIGGILTYIQTVTIANAAEEARSKAIDGTIIKSKELRDAYNQHILTLREVENEYRVIRGEITGFEADMDQIKAKYGLAVLEIKNETQAQLIEAGGIWNRFKDVITLGGQFVATERLKIMKESGEKIKAEQLKQSDEELKLQADAHKKSVSEWQKEMDDVNKWIQEEADKRAKKIEENNKKIWDLILKNLDKAIAEANALYVKDTDAFIREQDRKNKAAIQFWNKLMMDAVKLAGDAKEIEQARYLQELDLLKDQLNRKEITQLQFNAAMEIIEGTHKKNLKDIDAKAADEQKKTQDKINAERIKRQEAIGDAIVANAQKVEDAVFASMQKNLEREYKLKEDRLNAYNTLETQKIDDQVEQGVISQAQADQKRAALAAELEKKKIELAKKAFEDHKRLQIKQIEIALAVSLAEIWLKSLASAQSIATLGAAGVTQAALLSAIATAGALTEIGIVASQKFARGGIIDGPGTETSDSINIRASKNESMINAKSTQMFKPLLSAINVAGGGRAFARGGIPLPSGTSNTLASLGIGADMQQFADIVQGKIDRIKVYQVDKEVRGSLNKMAIIDDANTF